MKKITVILIVIIYSIIYFYYPFNSIKDVENMKGQKSDETLLEIEFKSGEVIIKDYKEDENERRWGILGGKEFMIYKDIDNYIFVDGSFYQIDGKWKNEKFVLKENDFKKTFNVSGSNGKYKEVIDKNTAKGCPITTEKDVTNALNNPNIPIKGSYITEQEGQLPGASREYRNGKHEGFDWYAEAIGVEITKETKVHPIYQGEIVRIDKEFEELEAGYRNLLLSKAAENNNTSQLTLDKLRGKQIWIQSENGVLVRYAHLDNVNEKLELGDYVKSNQWIGKVGNSGTSNGVLGTLDDLHLHTDIIVCGKNFWEYGEIEKMNKKIIEIYKSEVEQRKIAN